MKRRQFMTLLGGAVAAWPFAARAQQPERMRRIGVLLPAAADDPVFQARLAAFHQGLALLGWIIDRNVRIDVHWATANAAEIRRHAAELGALAPDVILATGDSTMPPLLQATRTVPIVFGVGGDPVQLGLVASLNRPGGNLTGFNAFASELGAKALSLLHELVPSAAMIGCLENPNNPITELTARDVRAAAPVIGLKVQILKASTDREIDAAFVSLVQARTGALLVSGDAFFNSRIEHIVGLAARHAIPTMYQVPEFVVAGGLISYGSSLIEEYRQVGLYAGRILKGEKPADLPVQQATKLELIINLKTAKALGLTVPLTLQASADEVIE